MTYAEARELREAKEAVEALEARMARLEAALTAMIPSGPGRKPAWVKVLTDAD